MCQFKWEVGDTWTAFNYSQKLVLYVESGKSFYNTVLIKAFSSFVWAWSWSEPARESWSKPAHHIPCLREEKQTTITRHPIRMALLKTPYTVLWATNWAELLLLSLKLQRRWGGRKIATSLILGMIQTSFKGQGGNLQSAMQCICLRCETCKNLSFFLKGKNMRKES